MADSISRLQAIPELQSLNKRSSLVRIPDQIDVPLTPRVTRLIDSAGFRRLRGISQLGLVSLVYPGACLLYTSPSPRDRQKSRMPSSA